MTVARHLVDGDRGRSAGQADPAIIDGDHVMGAGKAIDDAWVEIIQHRAPVVQQHQRHTAGAGLVHDRQTGFPRPR